MVTETEFLELAKTWYQRTRRLRELVEDANETPERKSKALKLFQIMAQRMWKVTAMATEIRTPKASPDFATGRVVHSVLAEKIILDGNEYIIPAEIITPDEPEEETRRRCRVCDK